MWSNGNILQKIDKKLWYVYKDYTLKLLWTLWSFLTNLTEMFYSKSQCSLKTLNDEQLSDFPNECFIKFISARICF